jgi:hypothetical protein
VKEWANHFPPGRAPVFLNHYSLIHASSHNFENITQFYTFLILAKMIPPIPNPPAIANSSHNPEESNPPHLPIFIRLLKLA